MNTFAPPTHTELVSRYGEPDDLCCAGEGAEFNMKRVSWAFDALRTFSAATSQGAVEVDSDAEQRDEVIGDLLCDIFHLITYLGGDHETAVAAGERHFLAEVGCGYNPDAFPAEAVDRA